MKKFELTTDSKMFFGKKLFRIKALVSFGDVEVGEIGGYVEKEENLSHSRDAWVSGDARVSGNAEVSGDARVSGNAEVSGDARVSGNAEVSGDARVSGNAEVFGDARVSGNAEVFGDARVSGNAEVSGDARVSGNARVSGDADYLCFKGLGSCGRNTTFFKCKGSHIHVNCGCFSGTLSEFEEKVKERHGDSKYAKEYLACVEVVKIHFDVHEKGSEENLE